MIEKARYEKKNNKQIFTITFCCLTMETASKFNNFDNHWLFWKIVR